MSEHAIQLIEPDALGSEDAEHILKSAGFANWSRAWRQLGQLADSASSRIALRRCIGPVLVSLADAAQPDMSLLNFERYVQSVPDRQRLFEYLAQYPRAVEILMRLFIGSQFLTEILLRNPNYLQRLTLHKRVAEFKHRQQLVDEANRAVASEASTPEKLDALRRFQRWEMLRIGACDAFGLFDLKSVTIQLSLLADSMVQSCMAIIAEGIGIDASEFVVLGFGKLGGEELNYSSDIDLVFLTESAAGSFWPFGQKLIRALADSTGEGFLYRVDMRLRPWGRSGALVNTVDAHVKYLREHGRLWEFQALLKARPIAGNPKIGERFLGLVQPLIFSSPSEEVCRSIRAMKAGIEAELERQGRDWGNVKSGRGSIRDIEFVTQFLQLRHGAEIPGVRSANTLDALVRLVDSGCVYGDEYRLLSTSYTFLRTIEHSLQLMHYKQTHTIPSEPREQAWLARRLDFESTAQFVRHYDEHCAAVRRIYDRYVGEPVADDDRPAADSDVDLPEHTARMDASYAETFSESDIRRHGTMLAGLSDDKLADVAMEAGPDRLWQITVAGYDQPGELSIMSGLLFVYGFDIVHGTVLSDVRSRGRDRRSGRKFVNVITVRAPADTDPENVRHRYQTDLNALFREIRCGEHAAAQGALAKRVARALRTASDMPATLYPVEIDVDNTMSSECTVLHIRAEDTTGFLYELSNALALTGIDIVRVDISSQGNRVHDTLYVTDIAGCRIDSEERLHELRTAIVLIKHFTHLLPKSSNPEQALLHFRDFLEQLFRQDNWLEDVASLQDQRVLHALSRLLGVSNFLWEDFLRLQQENLFPVVRDVEALAHRNTRDELEHEARKQIASAATFAERRAVLNAFKDREMFRTDMRHIMGHIDEFGQFSRELTDIAGIVVSQGQRLCKARLRKRFGQPMAADGKPAPLAVCALGKFGGYELGFASDIELMFVYDGPDRTKGEDRITAAEFFQKLVESFTGLIETRQEGIFQIDLRLRPFGQAGSLAVSLETFRRYFAPDGAAWPYERQALVKLRIVDGDDELGRRIVAVRDELVYRGERFDVAAMRAMREKQVRQLVKAGTLNAKLSPGGLVDCEYLVQGLQISHGRQRAALRTTNTREAMAALRDAGYLTHDEWQRLHDACVFLRLLIDALRMVRGHAKDLTVPPRQSEEFEFLARRLQYGTNTGLLSEDLERYTSDVRELTQLLD